MRPRRWSGKGSWRVQLEKNCTQLSDHVAEIEHSSNLEVKYASDMVKELDWMARRRQADICTLGYRLQHLEAWADAVAGDGSV